MAATTSTTRSWVIALGGALGALALAVLVAPWVHARDAVVALVAFVGGAGLVLVATAGTARAPLGGRSTTIVATLALGALFAVAMLRPASAWASLLVDGALLSLACAVGGLIGARIEDPGHLLPACVVAACADVASVVSPHGPSHAIAASGRALEVLAIGFPVLGTRAVAPVLGLGDAVFLALLLAAVARHALPLRRAVLLAALGLAGAGALSAWRATAIPALPFVSAALLAGLPAARTVRRKDRTVATIACGVAIALAAWTLARA